MRQRGGIPNGKEPGEKANSNSNKNSLEGSAPWQQRITDKGASARMAESIEGAEVDLSASLRQ